MLLKLALLLPFIVIGYILIRYRHLVKATTLLGTLLSNSSDDDGNIGIVDVPEKEIVQPKKVKL